LKLFSKNKISKKTVHKRAVFFDKLAKWTINSGGVVVILAVASILVFILVESYPLLTGASVTDETEIKPSFFEPAGLPLLSGIDEYQEIAFVVTDSATFDFINLNSKQVIKSYRFVELKGRKVSSASMDISGKNVALGLDSGNVALFRLNYNIEFNENDDRIITPDLSLIDFRQIDSLNSQIVRIDYQLNEDDQPTVTAITSNGRVLLFSKFQEYSLLGDGETTEYFFELSDNINSKPTDLSMDSEGEKLFVSTSEGSLYYFDVSDKSEPEYLTNIIATQGETSITKIQFLLGDQSVIVGDAKGNVNSFMKVLDDKSEQGWKLLKVHKFEKQNSAITSISASSRNKSFIAGSKEGTSFLYYLTTGKTILKIEERDVPVRNVTIAPKSNGAMILYADGLISNYVIDDPHPEVSVGALFSKVWYEGYQKPEYVWQSTGGSDAFESKLSLIPLILGTLKGTLYAMLFAIPLAILGALYLSTFSHPNLKKKIKPTVELMAALPSVVIGFIGGLWLAPLLERILPGVLLSVFILPLMITLGVYLWNRFPKLRFGLREGYEVVFIIPMLILGGVISIELGPFFESLVFGGDYRLWLSDFLNQNYDQRNSIVVGFAMGFAVIPIIFTMCEDALSSVPQHLSSASLALGASKWQTAVRVILPTASPGIFSAIMIGLGRAVGETMIVLMATGNTPILSFSPFNGMRTLSANIAVEIPEAPYHGTLYRVLFVSAGLLFLLTFIVNTIAEIVRQRLRKKYMHI
jgi:phosphate transport system permease protein